MPRKETQAGNGIFSAEACADLTDRLKRIEARLPRAVIQQGIHKPPAFLGVLSAGQGVGAIHGRPAVLDLKQTIEYFVGHRREVDQPVDEGGSVRLGALDVYVQTLLKPAAIHWRAALLAIRSGLAMPRLPAQSAATLDDSADPRLWVMLHSGSRGVGNDDGTNDHAGRRRGPQWVESCH